jgi:hypothetical protein
MRCSQVENGEMSYMQEFDDSWCANMKGLVAC